MKKTAKIIFIHGASSSGKSTLARALQSQLPEPFWHVSIDHLRDSGILPLDRFRRGDFNWGEHRSAFFEGFHHSLVAYASAGNNIVLEHILEEPQWVSDLAVLFAPFDVFFVGLHCNLDELVKRETIRADRPIGSAADDYHRIHVGQRYDLELSAGRTVQEYASQVLSAWSVRRAPSIFQQLALERMSEPFLL
ncbi:AAA family ATPase [Phyllobacterium sp. SB3]|uniref:chloramphenicol phosphotransferase CPT family protein n=1 Tax=Phyllobacterium sp. SB3 TaxID=3156073 RepID=UPI0032B00DD0